MRINIHKGWFRVWMVLSVLWVVLSGGYALLKNDHQNPNSELNFNYVYKSQFEKELEYIFDFFLELIIIIGPPIGVFFGVIAINFLARWIQEGFDRPS